MYPAERRVPERQTGTDGAGKVPSKFKDTEHTKEKMAAKSYRINVRFEEKTYGRLKEVAESSGLTMSPIVRSRIMNWLADIKQGKGFRVSSTVKD